MAGAGKGNGGGTSFESMSHEQMLAWLDQANAGEVQAAADRLTAAAKEIRKIADELKVRPQWVAWKGDGAEAFRTWADDLANSTHRLGDFSEGAGKWLSHASGAIATAQASTPRDTKSAQANLDAANAAHNDPDAAVVRTKSAGELAALQADREKVRLEAAAQMSKLGQSYDQSATQMNTLERPKFPPPPKALGFYAPDESTDLARPQGSTSGGASGSVRGGSSPSAVGAEGATHDRLLRPADRAETLSPAGTASATHHVSPGDPRPTATEPAKAHVSIDSVNAPTEVHQHPTGPSGVPPTTARPDVQGLPPTSGPVAPMPGGPVRMPTARGEAEKTISEGRLPTRPGQGSVGPGSGRGVTGTSPLPSRKLPASGGGPVGRSLPGGPGPTPGRGSSSGSGISGGRPTSPTASGRPMGRVPGGVFGGEHAGTGGASRRVPATGPREQSAAQITGPTAGRPGSSGRDGIVGGTPQRVGRVPARPGSPVPSAPSRGGISGGVPSEAGPRGVRDASRGSAAGARQRREKQRNDRRDEPPTAD
ncbi:translation initiation factor IF-2 [Streptomyces sp. NPDC006393]|uniref:translation initiation factor IF-2 n=1 Tax=Streptomyces sp. NPDC006393 TaxID=3156763 RepID=UPI003402FB45